MTGKNAGGRRTAVASHYVLPVACAALLIVGAAAAASHGRLSAVWVLALSALVVTSAACAAEPAAALFVAVAAWLTVAGFSGPPYAQLQPGRAGGARDALVLSLCALAGLLGGWLVRRLTSSVTLWIVDTADEGRLPLAEAQGSDWPAAGPGTVRRRGDRLIGSWLRGLRPSGGLDRRRQIAGVLMVGLLPALAAALVPARGFLSLPDDLLIFLVAVVGVAVVGGFWPAVLAAITASLLLNWFFTPPVHTFTIADPQNLLALLLFVTVAVSVSSVVHLAARRAVQAAYSASDAAALLALAQTVLGGDDTPAAILGHLTTTRGGSAELAERVGRSWVRVAVAGSAPAGPTSARVRAGRDLMLTVTGQAEPLTPRLLNGFAAQAAAALDRDRLRTQAAQAEALAEGNRMRTALLAAVSHDLRTPLASVKASVSTLRQAGVRLSAEDEQALLATIEQSADKLNGLIGNLLDMSRLSTGSLQPFLRPTSLDEVAPLALAAPGEPLAVRLVVPDDLPLIRTDPGLLERVLANLFTNAIEHSPQGVTPVMTASLDSDAVLIEVTDRGPGVPDQLKPRMFEPFERLGERNSGSGVGLGLAVAKGFLAAMGGTLTPCDTPGGGLTMRVRLPIAGASAATAVTGEQ